MCFGSRTSNVVSSNQAEHNRPVHGPGFPVFGFFPDQPKRSLLVRDGLASHGSMAG